MPPPAFPSKQAFLQNGLLAASATRLEDPNCGICMEAYRSGGTSGESPARLPCAHVFGRRCITRWFEQNNNCPTCRTEFFPRQSSGASAFSYQSPQGGTRRSSTAHHSNAAYDMGSSHGHSTAGRSHRSSSTAHQADAPYAPLSAMGTGRSGTGRSHRSYTHNDIGTGRSSHRSSAHGTGNTQAYGRERTHSTHHSGAPSSARHYYGPSSGAALGQALGHGGRSSIGAFVPVPPGPGRAAELTRRLNQHAINTRIQIEEHHRSDRELDIRLNAMFPPRGRPSGSGRGSQSRGAYYSPGG